MQICSWLSFHNSSSLPSPIIRWQQHWLQFIFKCIHFNYPHYLKQMVPFFLNYQLKHSIQLFQLFSVPAVSKLIAKNAFMFKSPFDWNNIPVNTFYHRIRCTCPQLNLLIMFYNFITSGYQIYKLMIHFHAVLGVWSPDLILLLFDIYSFFVTFGII